MAFRDGLPGSVERSQDAAHGAGHDYTLGSPHLRHTHLRSRIDSHIAHAIDGVRQRKEHCSVLEIGAGHGFFTDTVVRAGASVTVTEMSGASYELLVDRFQSDPRVRVLRDVDGNAPFEDGARYDVILLISVLHHIPDYLTVVTRLCDELLEPGGTVVTFQDPLWYPRQKAWERVASRGLYFAWRLTQGELRRGLATRWRRLRGIYSESEPSDLVEYHVVRKGVDDIALQQMLASRFDDVTADRYFSTQSPQLQWMFEKLLPPNTFGLIARGKATLHDPSAG